MTQRVVGITLLLCLFAGLAAQTATELPAQSATADTLGNLDYLFADSTGEKTIATGSAAPAINMFRYVLGLVVVLGLLVLLWYVLRRVGGHGPIGPHAGMKRLASFPLNNRQSLVLVRMLDTIYVLGVSTERVELVDKITDPETVERLTAQPDTAAAGGQFAGLLDKFRKPGS